MWFPLHFEFDDPAITISSLLGYGFDMTSVARMTNVCFAIPAAGCHRLSRRR
jgi:hypothetical protein